MGELLGGAEALDRSVFVGDALQVALPIAAVVSGELFGSLHPIGRLDKSGIDTVDADVVLDDLRREYLGEHINADFVTL